MVLTIPTDSTSISDDEIGRLLDRAASIPTWTKERHQYIKDCVALARKGGFIFFTGDFRTYGIEHSGAYIIRDVPAGQRGALSAFVGQRIRLVCLGKSDARAGRYFMAGIIRANPRAQ